VLALDRDKGEGIAEHQQVGRQVGQEAEHDHGRRVDRLPGRAQGVPRVIELDHQKWQQGEPGKARRRGQTSEQPRKQPALPSRCEHCAEGEEKGGRPIGGALAQVLPRPVRRPFHTGGGCYLVEQDGGDHAGNVADQQRRGAGGEAGRGDGADQGRIQREEGDQVARIAGRAIPVGGEVEVVLRVPAVPNAPEGGERIGSSPEFGQGQDHDHRLDHQRQDEDAQPGSDSIWTEPPNWKGSGTIATQRLAGRRAE
jgi:hypothetical protein